MNDKTKFEKSDARELCSQFGTSPTTERTALIVLALNAPDDIVAAVWEAVRSYIKDPKNHTHGTTPKA